MAWEYHTFVLPFDRGTFGNKEFQPQSLDDVLNQWGAKEWELVSVVALARNGWSNQLVVTLKRPR